MLRRYAAFHLPADAALGPLLRTVEDLDFAARSRAAFFPQIANDSLPDFPAPADVPEALGMLYVIEGSTLGGQLILRDLKARGIDEPAFRFLDPYGRETGLRWRSFLAVLSRETEPHEERIEAACRGALAAFGYAETTLLGSDA